MQNLGRLQLPQKERQKPHPPTHTKTPMNYFVSPAEYTKQIL